MKQNGFHRPSPAPEAGAWTPGRAEAARRDLALRRPETLLLLELLIEDPGPDGAALMRRLAGHLRLCADIPELAATAGCEPERIDPGLVRAAAGLLSDAARG
jgi:hypothetical protein